jgi:sulfur-oxidizing protein SoxY
MHSVTQENLMKNRREVLSQSAQLTAMLATLGLLPQAAQAQVAGYNAAAFEAKNMGDLMKALGGGTPAESKDVTITGPDIAENGAVVPVGTSTTLPGVKRLLLLVEKNPTMLSAMFDVTEAVDPNFLTRVKMGQSSNVFAVAMMADGKVLYAVKEIKVTLGGCGG